MLVVCRVLSRRRHQCGPPELWGVVREVFGDCAKVARSPLMYVKLPPVGNVRGVRLAAGAAGAQPHSIAAESCSISKTGAARVFVFE